MNSPPCTRNAHSGAPELPALLRRTAERLRAGKVDDADITAGYLLEAVCDIPRLRLPFERGRHLNPDQEKALNATADRVLSGEPLQYVLGGTDFYGRRFSCDVRALIPRPETECLIEYLLDQAAKRLPKTARIADVGAGTGCVAVTLALERPAWHITALDISRGALELARENAARHHVRDRIRWIKSDLLRNAAGAPFDLIAANLPYVPTAEYHTLPELIRNHEPRTALDGGPDGLRIIQRLIDEAGAHLAVNGELILEIGEDQADAVQALMERRGYRGVKRMNDLANQPRFMIGIHHGAI